MKKNEMYVVGYMAVAIMVAIAMIVTGIVVVDRHITTITAAEEER